MKKQLIYYFIFVILFGVTGSALAGTEDFVNTFYGGSAGITITFGAGGIENTFIGTSSGATTSSGSFNTYIGHDSGSRNPTGSSNTMVGFEAGLLNTGSGNVFIGYQAGNTESGNNKLYIDNSSTATPLIYGEFDNDIVYVYGDLDVDNDLNVNGNLYTTSDIRYKKDIAPITSSLDKIQSIRGVSFKYEQHKDEISSNRTHFGVIAQEVEKVMPEIVDSENENKKRVAYMELIPVLIEAVKEQQITINALSEKVETLERNLMLKGSLASVNHHIN